MTFHELILINHWKPLKKTNIIKILYRDRPPPTHTHFRLGIIRSEYKMGKWERKREIECFICWAERQV